MKKTFLSFLFVAIVITTSAQNNFIGFNAAVGTTWNTNLHTNYENRFFIHHTYGISFLHMQTRNFAYGADLNYSMEGANLYFQLGNPIPQSFQLKSRVRFLRFPMKAAYFFGKPTDVVRPITYIAPTLGYLVEAVDAATILHPGGIEYFDDNTSKKYNHRIDFGFQGGAGVSFKLSSIARLNTTVNYYHGIPNSWGEGRKNRNASFNASILWSIDQR